jgi:copper chaperone CopZ
MRAIIPAALLLLATLPLAADTLTFKVVGIDCPACAPPIAKALAAVDGVTNVKVDAKRETATVDVPADFDRERLRTAISNAGFDAIFPGEKRKEMEALPAELVKTLDIVAYDGRKAVDVAALTADGKVTVIDFYADWCGPCRVLETRLQRYMLAHSGLALRRVNIGKWDNAAAKQATKEFRAEALPYVRLYDAKGQFVTAVTGGMWDEVLAAIENAGKAEHAR